MTLLRSLRGRSTDRKRRLFACACGRRVGHLPYRGISAETSDACRDADRRAIEVAEQVADGLRAKADLIVTSRPLSTNTVGRIVTRSSAKTAAAEVARFPGLLTIARHEARTAGALQKLLGHAELFRDIFGNPFRPVTVDPEWRTVAVLALATGIYDDRAFDRMPILADALEDAGCDSDDIINHCRGPGPHVRGCWVVDLILGKS
jgi:hypothetical protein